MPRSVFRRDHTTRRHHTRRVGLAAVTCGILLSLTPVPAMAAPPPNPTDGQLAAAQAAQQAAANDVGRFAGLVASAETDLERITAQSEAASEAYLTAQGQAEQAQSAADAAAAQLRAAQQAVTSAQTQVAALGRDSYIRHETLAGVSALLDSAGPSDMLERAATLERLGAQRVNVLDEFRSAQARQGDAAAQAQTALAQMKTAEQAAARAKSTADTQLASSRASYNGITVQKAVYEQQLQQAQVTLLGLQGARNAYQAWQNQQAQQRAKEAAAAAAAARANAAAAAAARDAANRPSGPSGPPAPSGSGRGVAPTSGVFTTCFEMRWGVMHWGVDIAAPIGTPIYAPAGGVVLRAGPATGFGLAVYIQHDDGSVSVYGHINDYFVTAGQRVTAGQQIAEVGNKGESTGPHLHFEIATDGPYAGRIDPIPWLAARGVDMGGRCR